MAASLQLAGEGAAFRPDFSTLAVDAVLRRRGVAASFDEFFLDEVYRSDPNDFRPEVLLQQWSWEPPKAARGPV